MSTYHNFYFLATEIFSLTRREFFNKSGKKFADSSTHFPSLADICRNYEEWGVLHPPHHLYLRPRFHWEQFLVLYYFGIVYTLINDIPNCLQTTKVCMLQMLQTCIQGKHLLMYKLIFKQNQYNIKNG